MSPWEMSHLLKSFQKLNNHAIEVEDLLSLISYYTANCFDQGNKYEMTLFPIGGCPYLLPKTHLLSCICSYINQNPPDA